MAGYSLNYRDVDMTASGNWAICGPDITDHDLTIHIPAHVHPSAELDKFDEHAARSIAGNSDDFATAVENHPSLGVYAACNWCALVFEEDTNAAKSVA